jgi:hypothetical protein
MRDARWHERGIYQAGIIGVCAKAGSEGTGMGCARGDHAHRTKIPAQARWRAPRRLESIGETRLPGTALLAREIEKPSMHRKYIMAEFREAAWGVAGVARPICRGHSGLRFSLESYPKSKRPLI